MEAEVRPPAAATGLTPPAAARPGCAPAPSAECACAQRRATWPAGRSQCGTAAAGRSVHPTLPLGSRSDIAMLKKFDKKDEESGGGSNPFQHLEKSAVLQEASVISSPGSSIENVQSV